MDQFEKDFKNYVKRKSGKITLTTFYRRCIEIKFPNHKQFLIWLEKLTITDRYIMRDTLILPIFEHYYPLWLELQSSKQK